MIYIVYILYYTRISYIGQQLFSELNYNEEAKNCMKFKRLYGNIDGIYVPLSYYNMTTQRVLTMEFVEVSQFPP